MNQQKKFFKANIVPFTTECTMSNIWQNFNQNAEIDR